MLSVGSICRKFGTPARQSQSSTGGYRQHAAKTPLWTSFESHRADQPLNREPYHDGFLTSAEPADYRAS
jgi:hypothetical protein